jgi:hypothetical protein
MKKEISPAVIVAVLAVLVAVLGFFGYRAMNPEPVQGMDPNEFKKRMGDYQKANSMGGGGRPAPPGPAGQPANGSASGPR